MPLVHVRDPARPHDLQQDRGARGGGLQDGAATGPVRERPEPDGFAGSPFDANRPDTASTS